MYHRKWQLFPVFPLHQCLQCAVMNKPKQLSISNQHIWVPGWHLFNFAQVLVWCMLGMPSNSAIKAGLYKNVYAKSIDFRKKSVHQLDSSLRPQVNCSTHWATYMAVVFDGILLEFFPLHRLQPTAECKLATALTCGDKLEGGRWWVYGVRQLLWQCWQSLAS